MRRSDSLKKAEQRAREESEKLRLQEREQIAEKRRRDLTLRARVAAKAEEKKLELLFLRWSEHHKKLGNFLRIILSYYDEIILRPQRLAPPSMEHIWLAFIQFDGYEAISYVRDAAATSKLLERDDVDALEIHTNGRQTGPFKELWNGLGDSVNHLSLVAVSLPYFGDSTVSMMNKLYSILEHNLCCLNLWQLDGRPMSGDIGRGATRESIAFAHRLALANEKPPGFLQLAGGTNAHTVDGLRKLNLFQMPAVFENSSASKLNALIGGIAYGGYARKIVGRVLSGMQSEGEIEIESYPDHLHMALIQAMTLVGGVKSYNISC